CTVLLPQKLTASRRQSSEIRPIEMLPWSCSNGSWISRLMARQRFTLWSLSNTTIQRLSGEKRQVITDRFCKLACACGRRYLLFQNQTEPSAQPLTSVCLSGSTASCHTACECPSSVRNGCSFSTSHRRMVRSVLAEASVLLSGRKTRSVMAP